MSCRARVEGTPRRSHKAAFWKIGAQAPPERPGQKVLPWLLAYQCQPDVSAFV